MSNPHAHDNPIREIVRSERFASYLQPIFDIRTSAGFGYELLNRPFGINAENFYRMAFQLGYGQTLNAIALRRALAVARVVSTPVFVNVFPSDLRPADYDLVAGTKLVLEFSEHDAMRDVQRLRQETVERGIRVALDDFGTGHANLRSLIELTPAFVKLDRSVLSGLHESDVKKDLVRALTGLARDRFHLVAEGIEQPEEQACLVELEVPLGQGYHLGRPQRLTYRFP